MGVSLAIVRLVWFLDPLGSSYVEGHCREEGTEGQRDTGTKGRRSGFNSEPRARAACRVGMVRARLVLKHSLGKRRSDRIAQGQCSWQRKLRISDWGANELAARRTASQVEPAQSLGGGLSQRLIAPTANAHHVESLPQLSARRTSSDTRPSITNACVGSMFRPSRLRPITSSIYYKVGTCCRAFETLRDCVWLTSA